MAALHSDKGTFVLGYGKSHTVRFARPFAGKPRLELDVTNDTNGDRYSNWELPDEQHDSFTFANTGKKFSAHVRWKATGPPPSSPSAPERGKTIPITAVLGGIAALIATAWTCIQIWDWATK